MAARDPAPNGTQPHESDDEESRRKPISCEALDSAKEAEETIPQQLGVVLEARLKKLEQKIRVDFQADLEEQKQKQLKLHSETKGELQETKEELQGQIKVLEEDVSQLREKCDGYEEKLEEETKKVGVLEKTVAELRDRCQEYEENEKEEVGVLKKEVAQMRAKCAEYEEKLRKEKEEKNDVQSKLDETKNLLSKKDQELQAMKEMHKSKSKGSQQSFQSEFVDMTGILTQELTQTLTETLKTTLEKEFDELKQQVGQAGTAPPPYYDGPFSIRQPSNNSGSVPDKLICTDPGENPLPNTKSKETKGELQETKEELQGQVPIDDSMGGMGDRSSIITPAVATEAAKIISERQLTEEEEGALMEQYAYWVSTPNVVSIDYSEETTPGLEVLRVGVIKKLPREQVVHPDIEIPQYVLFQTPKERVKVFVEQVEEGPIVPLGAPYPGGSHLKTDGLSSYGCAAATVTFMGESRLLSAAHVLTNFDPKNIGREIYLRSYNYDKVDSWERAGVVSGQIGVECYLTDRECHPKRATQDLAWAEVDDEVVLPQHIEAIGEVAENTRVPTKGEKVKIFAGESGEKFPNKEEQPKVASTKAVTTIGFQNPTRYVYFKDVCRLKCSAGLLPGDSGSAIVGEDNAIIGLLFAGSETTLGSYYFCKI